MASETRDRFTPGARIGDYRIDREVANEETGVVYQATHVVLPRQVAVKVMHADKGWLRELAVQMLREACLLEALAHPGVPRIYECGVLADKRPWMAREWIDGASLAATMSAGPLPIVDVVVLIRDLADLLAHAHSRGVVHRGLVPETIVTTPKRHFSVCVRRWDQAVTFDTNSRVSVEPRDDIYGLGVVSYQALTGHKPDGVPAADRWPSAPAELTALIDQMLIDDAARRPTSEEVRDRTRWLSATIVPIAPLASRRSTTRDELPVQGIEDDPSGFVVRIRGRG